MKVSKLLVVAANALLLSSHASATVVFNDPFNNLSNWTPSGSAQIVSDPLNPVNNVLNFRLLGSGGDAFTGATTPGFFAAGRYVLDFDILGRGACVTNTIATGFNGGGANGRCGGYVGIQRAGFPINGANERWLVGDGTFAPTNLTLTNTGNWQHVSLSFNSTDYFAGAFQLKLEDFVRSPPAGDVYFDNFQMSVPEPASLALLGLGLAGLGFARRKKQQAA